VIDNAMTYLERSTNVDGGIRYQVGDTGPSRPAITAAAVACYFNAGQYDNPRAARALDFIEQQLSPRRGQAANYFGHYFYAHLYMSQVMYLAGQDHWQEYYPAMRQVLLAQQDSDDGSWDGDQVGTTYGTAVALIILQLPYKNLPIMQR
jgi:squalene cyclase